MAQPVETLTPEQEAEMRLYIGFSPGKNVYNATVPPGVTDDSASGFAIGSVWVDAAGKKIYSCADASVGAAVWRVGVVTSNEGYTITDPSGGEVKNFNPNTATMAELLDFVATLAKTLKAKSVI